MELARDREYITREELIDLLKEKRKEYPVASELARDMDISPKFFFNVVAMTRWPGTKVAKFLGYEEVVMYRKITPSGDQ